jgi:uncharacterized protein (DUF302 family)
MNKSLAGLCLIGAAAFMAGPAAAEAPATDKQQPLFIEMVSPADFPKTIDAFRTETKAAGWSIVTEHNLAGMLSARGYTLHPVIVLEVCNSKYGGQLLSKDENRYVSSMMPCRVSIYETSTGKVVISRMNASLFAGMVTGEVAEVMLKADSEMDAIISKTLARLK